MTHFHAIRWTWLFLVAIGCQPDELPPNQVDSGCVDCTSDSGANTTDSGLVPDEGAPLCINEFMPDNETTLPVEDGVFVDWIELHNTTDQPVSLNGWSLTDDEDEPRKHVFGKELSIGPRGFLVVWADAMPELGSDHLNFALAADGEQLGLFSPDGDGNVVTYGPIQNDVSTARIPDCCSGDECWQFIFRGTPGTTNTTPGEDNFIEPQATWKYFDAEGPPSPGWTELEYVDSTWASGDAPLGYGDTYQNTTLSYGGAPTDKHITAWFRHTFVVKGAQAFTTVQVELMRDDGAVVYLNGAEILRSNLPAGVIDMNTTATSAVEHSSEEVWHVFELHTDALKEGENVIAVELHQVSPWSDDLGMDMRVVGRIGGQK